MAALAMAFLHRLSLLLLLACSLLFLTGETRPSPAKYSRPSVAVSRLQSDGMIQCWDSLLELKACTGEVILFFLNGETNLGSSCCNAIRIIEHRCWPSMLTTIGFTPEEGDVLTGYCDASEARRRRATPPPPPTSLGPTAPIEYAALQGGLVVVEDLVH